MFGTKLMTSDTPTHVQGMSPVASQSSQNMECEWKYSVTARCSGQGG